MRNNRYVITALLIISIMMMSLLSGCTGKSATASAPTRKYEIVKVLNITDSQGAVWKTYQLRLTLEAGATFTVDLNLATGDLVRFLYITEKPTSGGSVNFQVKAGTTVVYPHVTTSTTGVTGTAGTTSDISSFTATQASGSSYRIIFHDNMADNSKETIYAEITYPVNAFGDDSIFIPLETN